MCTTVIKCLYDMGKIHKEEKWVPHQLSKNAISIKRLHFVDRQTKERRIFLYRIVTMDEKWSYFDNPK